MCPDSFSVSVSMYMKRREFILPSLLSLYLDTRVRGWLLLLAAHLCLMALTMRESPGLAPSRSPACSAFSLISFSRLTCRISIISTISTASTISIDNIDLLYPIHLLQVFLLCQCATCPAVAELSCGEMGYEIETVTMRSMTYETENKNETMRPMSLASSPSWRYRMSSSAIRESR